jgi:hypothetical protein
MPSASEILVGEKKRFLPGCRRSNCAYKSKANWLSPWTMAALPDGGVGSADVS